MSELTSLQRLHRIQAIDLNLDRLRAEEGNFPDDLKAARAEQDRLNNELEDTEITLEGVEKQVRQHELDLASIREQIERTKQDQEKNAEDHKVQGQYSYRLTQLEERAEELEEDLAPLRERAEELTTKASSLRGEHRALRPKLSELEDRDEQRIQELRDQGAGERSEREELVGNLDARTVKEYDMIRKAKKGLGLAEVRGGRCSACNVVLPVNVQQKVAQGKLPPVKCPSCGRFLIRLDL